MYSPFTLNVIIDAIGFKSTLPVFYFLFSAHRMAELLHEKPSLSSEDLVFLSDYDTMVQYEYRKEW